LGNNRYIQIALIALTIILLAAGCARRVALPTREDRVVMHQVVDGETLEMIADDYYGDPSRALELRRINSLDAGELEPGTIVQIVLNERELDLFNVRKQARLPYNRGLELTAKGSYLEAIGHFQDAIAVDPDFAEARHNLGVTYQKMKAYDKALSQFNEALRLRPEHPVYHFGAGTCHFYLEHFSEAARAFERVIAADPNHLKARYSLAVAYEKLDRPDQARSEWERYLRLDGTSEWAQEARKRLEKLPR
jgi:tetratricopeptide (TPR) repeat protein